MENASSPEKRRGPEYIEDINTGQRWVIENDGSRSKFTAEMEQEFERQQIVYGSGGTPTPTDGLPLFPRTIRVIDIDELSGTEDQATSPTSPDAPPEVDTPTPNLTPMPAPSVAERTSSGQKVEIPTTADVSAIPRKVRAMPERHKTDIDRTQLSNMSSAHTERIEPKSMREILADPKLSELFGELLKTYDDEDLILLYRGEEVGTMTDADIATLRRYQFEFTHRLSIAEQMREMITKEDVSFMMSRSPAFGIFRGALPLEESVMYIQDHLYLLSMRETESNVETMLAMQKENKRLSERTETVRLRERAEAACKRYNISLETIDSIDDAALIAFQYGDMHYQKRLKPETSRLIRILLKPSFKDTLLNGDATSKSAAILKAMRENLVSSDPASRSSFAELLGYSLSSDPRVIREIVEEARTGTKASVVGGEDVVTAKDTEKQFAEKSPALRANIDKLDMDTVLNNADTFKKSYASRIGKPESAWTQADYANVERDYMSALQSKVGLNKAKERRGWFARALLYMYESLLRNVQSQLHNKKFKPSHAI